LHSRGRGGSARLDPRSLRINTEIGFLIEDGFFAHLPLEEELGLPTIPPIRNRVLRSIRGTLAAVSTFVSKTRKISAPNDQNYIIRAAVRRSPKFHRKGDTVPVCGCEFCSAAHQQHLAMRPGPRRGQSITGNRG